MLKITYITHSSILIETEDAKIITDPWFNGPAYFTHWHVFPKPVDTSYRNDVTHVILTHGHEDHCHLPTLNQVNKAAAVYLPYTWLGGIKEMVTDAGFSEVHEMDSYKTFKIGKWLKLSFIVNGLDSALLIEYKGEIYLNLNDAFNATHRNFIGLFAKGILKKWKKVDYLMCGVGGAGYFPNMIRSPLKDDRETGILREQFLMQLFCEFVDVFKPKAAIPFLPGFILLEEDKRWINEIRQPRHLINQIYARQYPLGVTGFWHMFPGDYITEGAWHKASPYYEKAAGDDWSALMSDFYREHESAAVAVGKNEHKSGDHKIEELSLKLNRLFPESTEGIDPGILSKLDFAIVFNNLQSDKQIRCRYQNGQINAYTEPMSSQHIKLKINTSTQNLSYSINELWGGDVFFIGYGAEINIIDQACLEDNLDIVSLRILSRFPTARQYIRSHPYRALRYFYYNRTHASLALVQKFRLRKKVNKIPFNERSHWVNKSKCEICRLCNIPLLTNELAESI